MMEGTELKIFMDGQVTFSGVVATIPKKNHALVTLGAARTDYSRRANAVFDDLMIFDRAMTVEEINQVALIN